MHQNIVTLHLHITPSSFYFVIFLFFLSSVLLLLLYFISFHEDILSHKEKQDVISYNRNTLILKEKKEWYFLSEDATSRPEEPRATVLGTRQVWASPARQEDARGKTEGGKTEVGRYPQACPLTHRRAWRGGGVYINPQIERTAHAIGMRPRPRGWAMSSSPARRWLTTKTLKNVRTIYYNIYIYIYIYTYTYI